MEFELLLEDKDFKKLEIDTPTSVEVSEQLGQPNTFTLTFGDDICNGKYKLLELAVLDPLNSINIAIKRGKQKWYLIMGFIQSHSITVKNGGAGSQLQVSGTDNSAKLSWVEEKYRWRKDPLSDDDFYFLLSKVVVRNKKGKVISKPIANHKFSQYKFSEKLYTPNSKRANEGLSDSLKGRNGILQSSDDLSFIQRRGKQTSRYFWVSYEKCIETANFRKLPLKSEPDITLDVSGENNNIDQLSINWDINRPTVVENKQLDPKKVDKKQNASQNGAPQNKLAEDPVTLEELSGGYLKRYISSPSTNTKNMKDKSKSALNEAEWFIKAGCSTNFQRLCKYHEMKNKSDAIKPIHAHTLVTVKGTGKRYDGSYLVSGVTHTITPTSYDMQIQLQRNAWERSDETGEKLSPGE